MLSHGKKDNTMRISRTMLCAALTVALVALMTGAGMSGEQGLPVDGNQGTLMTAPAISLNRAGEIALEQVPGGMLVKSEYHFDQGRGGYSVQVIDGGVRVKLKIDATTGQVMSMERNNVQSVERPASGWEQGTVIQGGIDEARAREIALARTGGGTIVETDRDFKRGGRIVYEFEIVGPDRRYEIDVDGQTGAIIEYQEKRLKHGKNALYHD